MSTQFLYFIMKLDAIKELCSIFSTFFCFVSLVCLVFFVAFKIHKFERENSNGYCGSRCLTLSERKRRFRRSDRYCKITEKVFVPTFVIFLLLAFAANLLPSTKEMIILYVTPKILSRADVKKIPDNLINTANSWVVGLHADSVKAEISNLINRKDEP
jgi:hypothetical protein